MACQYFVFNTLIYYRRLMSIQVPDARLSACRRALQFVMYLPSSCMVYALSMCIHLENDALRGLYYFLKH